MGFNKITIIGNLGKDPELRHTSEGKPVCNFSIATSEKRKDAATGESKEETTWFRVTLWGRNAEIAAQYLKKGKQVYVEGSLRLKEWIDNDGKLRTGLEVTGNQLQLIGNGNGTGSIPSSTTRKTEEREIRQEEVPF